jgi:hypothetical protein
MKCLDPNPCEVKRPDGTCGASIQGYCEHQAPDTPREAPAAPEAATGHLAVDNGTMSQDALLQQAWIQETIKKERKGHI